MSRCCLQTLASYSQVPFSPLEPATFPSRPALCLLHAAIGLALKIALFVVELAFVEIVQIISDGAAGYDDSIRDAELEATAENVVGVMHNQVCGTTAMSCACCLFAGHFPNRVYNRNPDAGT